MTPRKLGVLDNAQNIINNNSNVSDEPNISGHEWKFDWKEWYFRQEQLSSDSWFSNFGSQLMTTMAVITYAL